MDSIHRSARRVETEFICQMAAAVVYTRLEIAQHMLAVNKSY